MAIHEAIHEARVTSRAARVVLGAVLASMLACNYVPLTDGGRRVAVLAKDEASRCQELGRTTSKTTSKAWLFERDERTVEEELESLARNEGSKIGGTAIAPLGPMSEGEQVFGIYRCIPPRGASEPAAG